MGTYGTENVRPLLGGLLLILPYLLNIEDIAIVGEYLFDFRNEALIFDFPNDPHQG